MNIGFDLDKVFVDYPPFIPDKLIDWRYKKKGNGTLLYRFPNILEQQVRKILHHSIFRPAIKENISFLKNLPRNKYKLYLISSRFGFLERETSIIMKKLGLDKMFDGIYFNYSNRQPHEFKNEIIKNLYLDKYVDDDFGLLKFVAKRNKKTQFYWLNNTNNSQTLTRNIVAIPKLSDIFS